MRFFNVFVDLLGSQSGYLTGALPLIHYLKDAL
ncbi:hypothetical protein SAMN06295945_1872 [Polynucleobacter meluiroseus]|uniref:Uncharacterized protein n=1 Tax=Polynucleobacter meluiroseus TaxID=1938814 RepID=A0A240E231_9BURK|nr:hypothetical protein SAMN06295945_1872 [Polynucleobacter meluiroseus]